MLYICIYIIYKCKSIINYNNNVIIIKYNLHAYIHIVLPLLTLILYNDILECSARIWGKVVRRGTELLYYFFLFFLRTPFIFFTGTGETV